MSATAIEWATDVWNPTTGCDRVSPGCDHCYALTMARRLKGMGSAKYQRDGDPATSGPGFGITEHATALAAPLSWRKPRRVFVNSMTDLFHTGVSDDFIASVFAVMAATPQHTYQVLTKRHGRMRSLLSNEDFVEDVAQEAVAGNVCDGWPKVPVEPGIPWWPLRNVWMGVSVEDQKRADLRIPALLDTPAAVRWLSCEPLLGPVCLDPWHVEHRNEHALHCGRRPPHGLHWVVAGGESGPGARPMHPAWTRQLRDQCTAAGVPFFFKQWGSHIPKDHTRFWGGIRDVTLTGEWSRHDRARTDGAVAMVPCHKDRDGRALDGRTWDEFPDPAR